MVTMNWETFVGQPLLNKPTTRDRDKAMSRLTRKQIGELTEALKTIDSGRIKEGRDMLFAFLVDNDPKYSHLMGVPNSNPNNPEVT